MSRSQGDESLAWSREAKQHPNKAAGLHVHQCFPADGAALPNCAISSNSRIMQTESPPCRTPLHVIQLRKSRTGRKMPSDTEDPGSQVFGSRLNYNIGFAGSPACRQWIVAYLNLHHRGANSHNKSLIYLRIYYRFCLWKTITGVLLTEPNSLWPALLVSTLFRGNWVNRQGQHPASLQLTQENSFQMYLKT